METTLYRPVKRFLEGLGFEVKGEVIHCDVVGVKAGAPPVVVIVELKLSFNLELVLQAVDRAAMGDEIWIAAKISKRGSGREGDKRFRNLCRRLSFGMLGIDAGGSAHILLSPAAPMPRSDRLKRSALMEEHRRRIGDPVAGGGARAPVMTAYRQRALACAAALSDGPAAPKTLKPLAPDAAGILRGNVYGWFERVARGLYGLTAPGRAALARWPQTRGEAKL